jgi:hypothetical protein
MSFYDDVIKKFENLEPQHANIIKNWKIKEHLTEEEQLIYLMGKYEEGGDCVVNSFIMFQKLFKLNAVRVRGNITNTNVLCSTKKTKVSNTNPHYWVELRDMVYDHNPIRTIIAPKKEYYDFYQIVDVEIADKGLFNKNNYKLESGPDDTTKLQQGLLPKFSICCK